MLDKRARKDSILRFLRANNSLFRVQEREREGAEKMVALMEAGIRSKRKNVDVLIGHYGWLYRYVNQGDRQGARRKIEDLRLFVKSNKPRFIFDELKKDPDSYLQPVMALFESALVAFEAEGFKTAKAQFERARDMMKEILRPRGEKDEKPDRLPDL
jgi:hypothetical protein